MLCLLLLPNLWSWPALALKTDAQQPIDVRAERGEAATRDGRSILTGGVEIQQGSMSAKADKAEIIQAKDGGISKVILNGAPATLKQTMDDGQQMDAKAKLIRYDVAAGLVVLEGGAVVNRGADLIQGQTIEYEPDTGKMRADGGSEGPIQFRFQPAAKPAAAASEPAVTPPAETQAADGETPVTPPGSGH